MTSIISGNTLGLNDSSLATIGTGGGVGDPSTGRAGERVYVNADTGNLVIQNQDDALVSVGIDPSILRTYNSQGTVDGDNVDGWRMGVYRSVSLTGIVNTAGSTVTRTDGDGAQTVFTYNATSGLYTNTDGGDAYDTISYNASTHAYTFTDGTSRNTESYDGNNAGRITQMADADGNAITYTYTGNLITRIQDASGESIYLDYTGNNLADVRVVDSTNNTTVRTRYTYDASNRLTQITTDLSPWDSNTADGNTYVVAYTYEGTSNRVSMMTQTDGSSLRFCYTQVGGVYKVTSITDAMSHVTTYSYAGASSGAVAESADPSVLSTSGTQTYTDTHGVIASAEQTTDTVTDSLQTSAVQTTGPVDYNLNPLAAQTTDASSTPLINSPTGAGWGAVSTLGGAYAGVPIVQYDGAGNGIAIWQNSTIHVMASRFTNNAWSTPVTLDASDSYLNASLFGMNLQVDSSGNAVATWCKTPGGSGATIYVARFVGGAWQATQTVIASPSSPVEDPSAAINAGGNVIVEWNGGGSTFARTYSPAGGFGSIVTVSATSSISATSQVAIDSAGNGMVVWLDGGKVYGMSYRATGGWQAAVLLQSGSNTATSPTIGSDASGNCIVMWQEAGNVMARRYVNGAWVPGEVNVSVTAQSGTVVPSLYVDESGNAIAAWTSGSSAYVARYVSGVWNAPENVGAAATFDSNVAVSINGSGQAAVMRNASAGGVYAMAVAVYAPGTGWSTATQLNSTSGVPQGAAIAMDANGNAIAMFQPGGAVGLTTAVYSAGTYPVTSGGWSASTQLDTGSVASATALVQWDGNGNAVAVWTQGNDVFARNYTNNSWGATTTLDSLGNAASTANLQVDASGNAVATWVQNDGSALSIYVARYVGGTWQAAELVETSPNAASLPTATINANGNVVVQWMQGGGHWANIYRVGSGWTGATQISTSALFEDSSAQRVGIDAAGNATVTWVDSGGVYAKSYLSSGGWQASVQLGTSSGASGPHLGMDGAGNVTVVWSQSDGVYARHLINGVWTAQVKLSTSAAITATSLYVDRSGNAIAVFIQSGDVWVARYVNGMWNAPEDLGTGGTIGTGSINGAGQAVVLRAPSTSVLAQIYTPGVGWSAATQISTSYTGAVKVSMDSNGNVAAAYDVGSHVFVSTYDAGSYYKVLAGDTWSSIANKLYGSTTYASALQAALGNPVLVAGMHLTGISHQLNATLAPTSTATLTPLSAALAQGWQAPITTGPIGATGTPTLVDEGDTETGLYFHASGAEIGEANLAGYLGLLANSHVAGTFGPIQVYKSGGTSGNLVAIWTVNSTIYASIGSGGTSWSSPVVVSGYTAPLLQMSASFANGHGLLTYVSGSPANVYGQVWDGSTWGSTSVVDTLTNPVNASAASIQQVAVDPATGKGYAVWSQADSTGATNVYGSMYVPGSGWQAATKLVSGATTAIADPQITFDSSGVATLVWAQGSDVLARTWTASTGVWTSTVTLDSQSTAANNVRMTMGSTPVVTWDQGGITYAALQQNSATNTWSAQETVGTGTGARVASNGAAVIVAWTNGTSATASVRSANGTWSSSISLGTVTSGSVPGLSVDSHGNAYAMWTTNGTVTTRTFYGSPTYIVPAGATWTSVATALYGTPNAATALQEAIGPNLPAAGAVLANMPATLTITVPPSYTIRTGDTWASIATYLYGWAGVGDELQAAMGNPALTAGASLNNLPRSILDKSPPAPLPVPISVPPYYIVQSGDTWSSIGAALYNSPTVASSLATQFGSSPTVGARLTLSATAGGVGPVAPYYVVQAGDTWASIATTLYHSSGVAGALQHALDPQTLTVGAHLTGFPFVLGETVSTPPYYNVQAGDTWESIATALYGNKEYATDLQNAMQIIMPGVTLTAGVHLVNLPSSLSHDYQGPAQPYYVVQPGDTWASIAVRVYGDDQAASALQLAMGSVTLTAGVRLIVPASVSVARSTEAHVDVTDPLGNVTSVMYDVNGRLTGVMSAAVTGPHFETRFSYDANGNVTQAMDDRGNAVNYTYDANGNRILDVDAFGNRVERTFGSKNELLTETTYPASGSSQTTREVYNANDDLVFTVTPEGRVTENRYDSFGDLTATLTYSALYPVTGLSTTTAPTLAQMGTWSGANQNFVLMQAYGISTRGLPQVVTTYSNADGVASFAAGTGSATTYNYDIRGNLVSVVDASNQTTSYTHDGMGRVLTMTDGTGNLTTYVYTDASDVTAVTYANGLVVTSTYDKDGRLTSVAKGTVSTPSSLGTSHNYYDADERLRRSVDETGVMTQTLYDVDGRIAATIDGTGALTQYTYDPAGNVILTTQYANPVSAANLASLYDASGNPTDVALATILPTASSDDHSTWNIYDADGRLVKTVDGEGAVTQNFYDGTGQLTDTIQFATRIDTSVLKNAPLGSAINPPSDPSDRHTRNFYDQDGSLRGTLDGEGYLVEYRYDSAGQLKQTVAYKNATAAGLRSSGTLAQLLPAPDVGDIHSYFYYDVDGRAVGQVDGAGSLTEYTYDTAGNRSQVIRYATTVTAGTTLAATRPATAAEDQTTTDTYDADNRLLTETDPDGLVTSYVYDGVGNILQVTRTAGASDKRTQIFRYDLESNLIREYNAHGSALYNGTEASINTSAALATLTTYTYDAAGRRTSVTDALGHKTLSYYDNDGRLAYTVDAMGDVEETDYNAFGGVKQDTKYGTALSSTTLAGLSGGLTNTTLTSAVQAIFNSTKDSTTRAIYNKQGLLLTSYDALNYDTTYGYDAFGDLQTEQQRISLSSQAFVLDTYSYDRRGLQTFSVLDIGQVGSFAIEAFKQYDAFGRAISVITNGSVSERTYDKMGREVTASIDGIAGYRQTSYDALGRVLKVWADGTDQSTFTRYTYNTAAGTVTVTTPVGDHSTTTRDKYGEVTHVTDGRLIDTPYVYDVDGNVIETDAPAGIVVSSYNALNQVLRQTNNSDVGHYTTQYGYDADNRLASSTVDPNGLALTTTTTYDAKGQILDTTDANGVITRHQWDLDGNLLSTTVDPGGLNLVTSYTYDGLGDTLSVTDPNGNVTQYTYDRLGRRIQERVDPNGLNLTTSYTYNERDQVVAVTDPRGNRTLYVRDAADRVIYTVDALGDVTKNIYDSAGRLSDTIGFATPIGVSGLSATSSVNDLDSRVVSSSSDNSLRRVYDGDGRLRFTISATNALTEYRYDADGNVIAQIAYAQALGPFDWTDLNSLITEAPLLSQATSPNQSTRTIYDTANRAQYVVDGTGAVTAYVYDANNNVVKRTSYAQPIPVATTDDQVGNVVHSSASDQVERYFYDNAQRRTGCIDGTGAVTTYAYDRNGNVTSTTQFANRVGVNDVPSQVVAWPANDRVVTNDYDSDNRLTYTSDGTGAVTRYEYDADGNVTHVTQFANRVTSGADPANVTANAGNDRITTTLYDAAGRAQFVISARTGLTENVYDANGNLTARIAYQYPPNAPNPYDPTLNAASFRSRIQHPELRRESRTIYDAANHAVFTAAYDPTVSPVGADQYDVVAYTYDALGNVVTRYAYANRVVATWQTIVANGLDSLLHTDGSDRLEQHGFDAMSRETSDTDGEGVATTKTLDSIGRVISTTVGGNRTTNYTYDATGRELSCTTVMGTDPSRNLTERWTYDALGNKLTYTNQNSDTWNYTYDPAGNLTQELSPQVATTTLTQNGAGPWVPTTTSRSIATTMQYNAFGEVSTRTEDAGGANERTTTYLYDRAGNQTRTTFPGVAVYGQQGTVALYSEVTYDAFGDAIANRDTAGHYSYKVYNTTGQVVYDIDTMGTVTMYFYDEYPESTGTAVFGTALDTTGWTPATIPGSDTILAPLGTNLFATVRQILTIRDALGRQVSVSQPPANVTTFDANPGDSNPGLYNWNNAVSQTATTYNAFGEIAVDGLAGIGTQHFYDHDGRESYTVDPLGYVTAMTYDAAGNLIDQIQYASARPGWTPATQLPAPGPNDRETQYQYDNANRKVSQTQLRVNYTDLSGNAVTGGSLTTQYTYDGVGNATSTTDAASGVTYSYYDALGRIRAIVSPARIDNTGATPTTIIPVTEFKRDALGNVVEKIDYSNGAISAGVLTYAVVANSSVDRATFAVYDTQGHTLQSIDGLGHSTSSSYDASGNLAEQSQSVTVTGASSASQLTTDYRYDAAGRLTQTIENPYSGTSAPAIVTQNTYNVFGEKIQTTVTGDPANGGEHWDYNAAGQVWRTNSGDGVWKVYLYDYTGSISAELTSATFDISTLTQASDVFSHLADFHIKGYENDALGRVTATVDGVNTAGSQPAGYWMPQQWDTFRLQLEGDFANFFGWAVNQTGTWGGGTLTRNQGNNATWTAPSGAVFQFRLSDGPIPLISESAELRAGLTQQYHLTFVLTPGSYVPDSFTPNGTPDGNGVTGYRAAEYFFNAFFGTYNANQGSQDILSWMGGTIQLQDPNTALFIDAQGTRFTFHRTDGFLTVASENATIRAGWEQDFGFSFVGDSGERMEQIGILDSNTGSSGTTNHTNLTWPDISELGDGDVKLVVDYHDTSGGTHEYTQIFASNDAATGVSLSWNTSLGVLGDLDQLTIYKKDVSGAWQQVTSQQAGQAAAGVLGSIFTAVAPSDPSIVVQATIGAADAGPPVNFGDRLLFTTLPPAAGTTLPYTIWYLFPGAAARVAHSTGTITTPAPAPVAALDVNVTVSSTGQFTWAPPQTGIALARFNPNAVDEIVSARFVNYRPSNYDAYRELENDTATYFNQSSDAGSQIAWMDGTLTRVDADHARYDSDGPPPVTFTFSRTDSCLWIAAHCPAIRDGWTKQFAAYGISLTFVPYADGFFPGDTANDMVQFENIEADFDGLFAGPPGDVSFMGGQFHRTGGDAGSYTYNGTTISVNRDDGPLVFIHDSDAVRIGWELRYGIQLTASTWNQVGATVHSDNASAENVSHSVDFNGAVLEGAGTYQYEIVVEQGLKPIEHAIGFIDYTAANSGISTGLQAVTLGPNSFSTQGGVMSWPRASGDTATIKYRVYGSTDAYSPAVPVTLVNGTTFSFNIGAAGMVPATGANPSIWDIVIDYTASGSGATSAYAETKLKLTATAPNSTAPVTVPTIGTTIVNTNTPYADPSQYYVLVGGSESDQTWQYIPPVASADGTGARWGSGYGAPYTIDSDGNKIYGPAVALGNTVVAELKFAKPSGVVDKVFSYELAGSNAWHTLPVASPAGANFVVDASQLPTGSYNYKMEYFYPGGAANGATPLYHTDGIFTITQGQQGSMIDNSLQQITAPLSTASAGFVTWPVPENVPTADFRYQPSSGGAWTAIPVQINNGQYQATISGLANGSYNYQIFYTMPGMEPYAMSSGTLNISAQSGLMPSNAQGMNWLQYDTNLYFSDSADFPVGGLTSWGSPTIDNAYLFRGIGDTSYFIPSNSTYTFHNDAQWILNNLDVMRNGWASEFGITWTHLTQGTFIPRESSLIQANDAAMLLYFNDSSTYKVGADHSISWCGGTLTKLSSTQAMFTDANHNQFYFNKGDSTQTVGNLSAAIRQGWHDQMGLDFDWQTAGTWVADAGDKYNEVTSSLNAFFTTTSPQYAVGSMTPWQWTPGASILRGNDSSGIPTAYFVLNAFAFQRTQLLQAAAQNATMKQVWEAQFAEFGLTFISSKTVTITPTSPGDMTGQVILATPTILTVSPNATPIQVSVGGGSTPYFTYDTGATVSTAVNATATAAKFTYGGASTPGPQALSVSLGSEAYAPRIATSATSSTNAPAIGPTVLTTYDRWGNVTSVSDARNAAWKTTYQYDAMNDVTSITKANVSVTSEAGSVSTSNSQMTMTYDAVGRQVSTTDANGYTNKMRYDAAGELIQEDHADAGVVKYGYDAFGDQTGIVDADGNLTSHTFNRDGELTSDIHAQTEVYSGLGRSTVDAGMQSRTVTYQYDEIGRRIAVTDPAGATNYTYDERGNLVQVIAPGNVKTSYQWDARNRKTAETTADAITQTWTYNGISSNAATYVNLAGDTTRYTYDLAGQLTKQRKLAGSATTGTPLQELTYGYDDRGEVLTISDTVDQSLTTYSYDAAGNKITENFQERGATYQDNQLTYDAQGRLTTVVDSRHHVDITYDAVGNRRSVIANFYLDDSLATGGAVTTTSNWYTYDSMNRVKVENGVKFATYIDVNSVQGVKYTYDHAGNKLTSTQQGVDWLANSNGNVQDLVTTTYQYDQENRLIRSYVGPELAQTPSNTNDWGDLKNTTGIRRYDAAGRLKYETTYNLGKPISRTAEGGDDYGDEVFNDYNADGTLHAQTDEDYKTATRYTVTDNYDAVGNLQSSLFTYRGAATTYTYTYVKGSSYQELTASVAGSSASNAFSYDANGNLVSVSDSQTQANNRRYVNDVAGSALARVDGVASSVAPTTSLTVDALAGLNPAVRIQHSLVVDEQTLGISAMALGSAPALTRFDFGAHASGSIGDSPMHYVVTSSDHAQGLASLQGVAQAIYGDSSLWYVIAEANGITSGADLTEGKVLTIPNSVVDNKNNLRTFKPYDPTEIRGDNGPKVPPPQGGNGGCGTMGTIIMAVVAIVVTIYTAGAAASLFAEEGAVVTAAGATTATSIATTSAFTTGSAVLGLGGTTTLTAGEAIAASVVGGAVGSAVSQGIGMAMGMQDQFSWRGVATSALSAGLTTGAAPYLNDLATAVGGATIPDAGVAAKAATASALRQGLSVALGNQKQFSWAGVAAAAIASTIAGRIGGALGSIATENTNAAIGGIVRDFAGGFMTQVAVSAAQGGKVQLASIAADAFGNALGEAFAVGTVPVTPSMTFSEDVAARTAANPIMDYMSRNPQVPVAEENYVFSDRVILADAGGGTMKDDGYAVRLTTPHNVIKDVDDLQAFVNSLKDQKQAQDEWDAKAGERFNQDLDARTAEAARVRADWLAPLQPNPYALQVENPTFDFITGVGGVVGSAMKQPFAVTADLIDVADGLTYAVITGKTPPDIDFRSGIGRAAAQGADTGQIVNGGFQHLTRLPDTIADSYLRGDFGGVGRGIGEVGVFGVSALTGGSLGSVRFGRPGPSGASPIPPLKFQGDRYYALVPSNGGTGPLRWVRTDRFNPAPSVPSVHGNSLANPNPTHVYAIRDGTGAVWKIGESAQGVLSNGASIRGAQQVRDLNRLYPNKIFDSEIRVWLPNKADARSYETDLIERFRSRYGQDRLPGNLTNR